MNPDSLAAELLALYHIIDTQIANHFLTHPNKAVKMPCKKGCSHCCSQFFEISEVEAFVILDSLKNHDSNTLLSIKSRLTDAHRQFITAYPQFYQRYFLHSDEEPFDSEAYFEDETRFSIRIPCVFLDEAGGCTIYPVRPLICRTTGGSFTEQTDEGSICERLSSAKSARLWQTNLENLQEKIWSMNELITLSEDPDEIIELRQLPLFYSLYQLLWESPDQTNPFNNPWLLDYFNLSRKALESKLYDYLIL